jgi:hypothetical protein
VTVLFLNAQQGWRGLPYAIGMIVIILVALIVALIGRYLKDSKPERLGEDAKAAALIDRNAEAAGWGPPRQHHEGRRR